MNAHVIIDDQLWIIMFSYCYIYNMFGLFTLERNNLYKDSDVK